MDPNKIETMEDESSVQQQTEASPSLLTSFHEKCLQTFGSDCTDVARKLFAVVDYAMTAFATRFFSERNDPFNYRKGHYRTYLHLGRIIQVSLTDEKNESGESWMYIVIRHPNLIFAYRVINVLRNNVPEFSSGCEEDVQKLRDIFHLVADVFDDFLFKFAKNPSSSKQEYSDRAIEPALTRGRIPTVIMRKRKIDDPYESPYVVPQPVENPAYAALKTIFMSLDDKPTEHAILFAVLKTVLSYYLNLSVNVEKNGWPGGATYNSKVYQLMVPDYCKKKDDGTPERKALHTFNFVVLKTADEYFLSLRNCFNSSHVCVKKIEKTVIPTFAEGDQVKRADCEKFSNLTCWLTRIFSKFVMVVVQKNYNSTDQYYNMHFSS